jgi:hypothetical protein
LTVVLDSWVVLRFLEDAGDAAVRVAELLDEERPLMSGINLGEVYYVLRRLHGEPHATDTVRDLRAVLDVRLPDERHVLDAARIKADGLPRRLRCRTHHRERRGALDRRPRAPHRECTMEVEGPPPEHALTTR